jgi:hypothetical protein
MEKGSLQPAHLVAWRAMSSHSLPSWRSRSQSSLSATLAYSIAPLRSERPRQALRAERSGSNKDLHVTGQVTEDWSEWH